LERPRELRRPVDFRETLAYSAHFLISDAEQHFRGIVSVPQEYMEARQERLPREQHKVSVSLFAHHSSSKKEGEDKGMRKYVIERDIPSIGNATVEEVLTISQKSCRDLNKLGPAIQWLHSCVTADKIYRDYIAASEEMVREHARQGGFPANRVSEVKLIIDPTSAEA
jgi:hypothetical protein